MEKLDNLASEGVARLTKIKTSRLKVLSLLCMGCVLVFIVSCGSLESLVGTTPTVLEDSAEPSLLSDLSNSDRTISSTDRPDLDNTKPESDSVAMMEPDIILPSASLDQPLPPLDPDAPLHTLPPPSKSGSKLDPFDPSLPSIKAGSLPGSGQELPPVDPSAGLPQDPNAPARPPQNIKDAVVGPAACNSLGLLFSPPDYGVELGQPISDPGVTILNDGKIRLYIFAQGVGVVSATSDDGIKFTQDPGVRLPEGIGGQSKPFKLDDGRIRLYSTKIDGINSFISEDGLTFVEEAGYRVTAKDAGLQTISSPSIIEISSGKYRMYYSTIAFPGEKPGGRRIGSAFSSDLMNWTVDPGFRLGPGSPNLTDSAEHPAAVKASNGSLYLFYGKFPGPGTVTEGMYRAESKDGINFDKESYTGLYFANDAAVLKKSDGGRVLYYGDFDTEIGGQIFVAECEDW